MRRPLRVLYLQLPVPDFGDDYWGADHPLAGGSLATAATAAGVAHEALFLPPALTSRASTPAIVQAAAALRPDVVAATLFLWNVERTIAVVLALRARLPGLRALAGGPECPGLHRRHPGHPFDWVCALEGERRYTAVLAALVRDPASPASRLAVAARRRSGPVDLATLPSPYLDGPLTPAPDGSLWVETMRGCPHDCAFCYYAKAHRGLRHYPNGWLGRHLAHAARVRATEMYLLDPSFQATPRLAERLEGIALANRARIPLHTEVRAERLTPALADAMVKAGFRSVETGLQSIHPEALRAVRRTSDPAGFVRGARLLKERGIGLIADAILGLPDDTPEGFLQTIDFLVEAGLSQETVVFPLLFLPGTDLRRQARDLRCRHQGRAPHQVVSTPAFDPASLRELVYEAEQRLEQALYPIQLPDLSPLGGDGERVHVLRVTGPPPTRGGVLPARLTHNPVILFEAEGPVDWAQAFAWLRWQRAELPDATPFWGFAAREAPAPEEMHAFLRAAHDPDSYTARRWSLAPEPYLRLSCRPFVLSACEGPPEPWLLLHGRVPVIRHHRSRQPPEATGPLGELPVLWDAKAPLPASALREALRRFEGREQDLLLATPRDAARWRRLAELPDAAPYPLGTAEAHARQ